MGRSPDATRLRPSSWAPVPQSRIISVPSVRAHLHTRRVAPVANRARPRLCQRASRPPEPNAHRCSLFSQLLQLRLRPLQPQSHFHLTHHRRRSSEMLFGLLSASCPPVQFAQTNVAMSDERAHAEFFSEGHSSTIMLLGFLNLRCNSLRANLAQKPERLRLLASFLGLPREIQGALHDCDSVIRAARLQIRFAQPAKMNIQCPHPSLVALPPPPKAAGLRHCGYK